MISIEKFDKIVYARCLLTDRTMNELKEKAKTTYNTVALETAVMHFLGCTK